MRTAWLALAAAACATPAVSTRPGSASPSAPIEPSGPISGAPAASIEPAAPVGSSSPAPEVGFRVLVAERTQLTVGQPGAVSVTVAPGAGYTISQVGPLRVDLAVQPPEGLDVPRRRYRRDQAADRRADAPRFDLAVRGARPGAYVLAIEVRLWLCRIPPGFLRTPPDQSLGRPFAGGSGRCHPARQAVAPVVEVQGPAPSAPAPSVGSAPAQR